MKFVSEGKDLIDILSAIAPALIGIYLAFIARRQAETAREKLRLDLYNRRFHVYQTTISFFNNLETFKFQSIKSKGKSDEDGERFVSFFDSVRESKYLFDDKSGVHKTLSDLRDIVFELSGWNTNRELLKSDEEVFHKMLLRISAKPNEINKLLQNLEVQIAPYLNFGGIKKGLFRIFR